jgi:chromosome segregation ATPase
VTSLLDLTADLERRDAVLAAEIDSVSKLADGAKEISARAEAIDALLESSPAEHASLDRAEAEALALRELAEADLAAASALVSRLAATGRDAHAVAEARRDLEHAEVAARDAVARVERIVCMRAALVKSEHAAKSDLPNLVAEALALAGRLAELSRVSASGRAVPEQSLGGLVEWAARVHAALVVVRGQLDVERDRLVREANELGSVVLGEPLAGNSVALVGRRVRTVLAG